MCIGFNITPMCKSKTKYRFIWEIEERILQNIQALPFKQIIYFEMTIMFYA